MNLVCSPNPLLDGGSCIPEELVGRLHHATEHSVIDLVAAFTANERARLGAIVKCW
jgi:hypothetical protein